MIKKKNTVNPESEENPFLKDEDTKKLFSLVQEIVTTRVEGLMIENASLVKRIDELNNQVLKLTWENTKLKENNKPLSAAEVHSKLAADFAISMYPALNEVKSKGYYKIHEIAEQFNSMGLKTRKGGKWVPSAIFRLEKRQQEDLNLVK